MKKSNIIRFIITLSFLLGFEMAHAGQLYLGGLQVKVLRVGLDNYARVGFNRPVNSTCEWYGEVIRFDVSTPAGQSMYKTLLSARVARQVVQVWYMPSQAPGTNHTNGCRPEKMSTLNAVGIDG